MCFMRWLVSLDRFSDGFRCNPDPASGEGFSSLVLGGFPLKQSVVVFLFGAHDVVQSSLLAVYVGFIPRVLRTLVKFSLVNWLPWAVLKISDVAAFSSVSFTGGALFFPGEGEGG